MKILYSILWLILIPLALLRLVYLSFQNPKYLDRVWQRLGFIAQRDDTEPSVWIHAVSVGETIATQTIVKAIQEQYPELQIVFTTGTPTGADTVSRLYGDSVEHYYQPYDLGVIAQRFLNVIKPRCLLLMETELWPNLIAACHQQKVPVLLLNARMSERSKQRYQKFASLTQQMLQQLTHISAQTEPDQNRLIQLGASPEKLSVTGSIKFDLNIDAGIDSKINEFRDKGLSGRPIWIAASTHPGEEKIMLQLHQELIQEHQNCLLVLVPRHPHRSGDIESDIKKTGLEYQRWSNLKEVSTDTLILLVDTIGELLLFYAVADVCFVGGSLVEEGGHNPLEPAYFSKPILFGPHDYNFLRIGEQLLVHKAAIRINNQRDLFTSLNDLLADADLRSKYGNNAKNFLEKNRGATKKIWNIVQPYLD